MKLAICTLNSGDEYKETLKLCIKSLEIYCQKHNYPLINDESILDTREPMWNKVLLIEKYLHLYDYIIWIDADMMIMNTDIKLENIIYDYMGDKDIMMATDSGNQINTGTWFIRNSQYSRDLIHLIYNLPELAGNYHEQGVFMALYEKNLFNLKKHTVVIPENKHNIFNCSMYTYNYGDFLIHFLGIHRKDWLEIVTNEYYPYKKDNEDIEIFNNRINHIKSKSNGYYSTPQPYIKICICTILYGEKYTDEVVYYGQKSLKDYCNKHGYDLVVQKELLDENLPPHWSKVLLLNNLLQKDYNYVIWLDADILICNHDIKLENIMKEHMNGKSFLLSRDVSGHINTGVWFVKNCEYSKKILELNYKLPELRYRGYEDQDVFNRIYERNLLDFTNNCSILDTNNQHIFNCCIGLYNYGMFLIHFYSLSKEGLEEAFKLFYPFKKDDENDFMYEHRLNWIKQR